MATQASSQADWEGEIRRRRAAFLNYLLLAAVVSGLAGLIWFYFGLSATMSAVERLLEMRYFIVAWLLTLVAWLWRGGRTDSSIAYRVRSGLFILIAYGVAVWVFYKGGLPGSGRVWLLLTPALSFVLLGAWAGVWSGVLSILTYLFFTLALVEKWVTPQVADDLTTLSPLINEGASFLVVVALMVVIFWVSSRYWVESLKIAAAVNLQLQTKTRELEDTNVQLRRQTSQLQAATEISRACTSILNPERLLKEVVSRIEDGFSMMGVYHVGLFLLDEEGKSVVLKAATGEVGRLALEMGYQVTLEETSVDVSTVGWCVVHRHARIALNLKEKTVWFGPAPMPHTRSEITLPLHSRGEILGALNVHSSHEAAFSESDVAVLQAMADQIATAIDNARLFSQTQAALEEVRAIQRHYLAQSWRHFLEAKALERVDYTGPGVDGGGKELIPLPEDAGLREACYRARLDGKTVLYGDTAEDGAQPMALALVAPLRLREHVIGTVALRGGDRRRWTEEDIALVEAVVEQLALTIDNLRLFDETQRRATYERLVGEIAGRVRASLNPDAILKATVQELGRALDARRVSIEIAGGGNGDHPASPREEE